MVPRGTLRQAQGRHSLAARGSSVLVEDGRGGAAARRAPGQGAARLAGQRLGSRGSGSAAGQRLGSARSQRRQRRCGSGLARSQRRPRSCGCSAGADGRRGTGGGLGVTRSSPYATERAPSSMKPAPACRAMYAGRGRLGGHLFTYSYEVDWRLADVQQIYRKIWHHIYRA